MKQISIAGSTGSIGTMALDVVRKFPDQFKIVALAARNNTELMARQIEEFKPRVVSLATASARDDVYRKTGLHGVDFLYGLEGISAVSAAADADMVISCLSGAAGMLPTRLALEAGKNVGLANKESLVMAGNLLFELVRQKGVHLIPIDSEHSAIFQCLAGNRREDVLSIVLTASGGPFREYSNEALENVTAAEALAHPVWSMGPKISIDSATLMNKGLEVIEAYRLFNLSADQVEIVIHPQSIIHSMVRYCDGSIISQMSRPDMRLPILYALTYPERWAIDLPRLDLAQVGKLTFEAPDFEKFPCLKLAFDCLEADDGKTIVLNRADEVAVHAFLQQLIAFTDIPKVIQTTLQAYEGVPITSFEDIDRIDSWADVISHEIIEDLTGERFAHDRS